MITVSNGLSDTYFSAMVPDIIVTITGYRLAVVMETSTDGATWSSIYSEYLYPVGGSITIGGLPALLNPYARKSLFMHFRVTMEEEFADSSTTTADTETCDIVYSEAEFPAISSCSDFISTHFLTILMGDKVTGLGRLEYLHYIGTDDATATAVYSDGTTKDFAVTAVGGNNNYRTIDVSPSLFTTDGKTLVAFYVVAGSRRQDFIVDPDNPDCAPIVIFVNSFGVEELLYCTGVHTKDPSFKRETTYIDGEEQDITITETRNFKADTGVLNEAMAEWFGEVLRSRYVRILTIRSGKLKVSKRVVISDSSSKQTNEKTEMPRFTFTYHYAQRNQNIVELAGEGRIFDNTFDNTFN